MQTWQEPKTLKKKKKINGSYRNCAGVVKIYLFFLRARRTLKPTWWWCLMRAVERVNRVTSAGQRQGDCHVWLAVVVWSPWQQMATVTRGLSNQQQRKERVQRDVSELLKGMHGPEHLRTWIWFWLWYHGFGFNHFFIDVIIACSDPMFADSPPQMRWLKGKDVSCQRWYRLQFKRHKVGSVRLHFKYYPSPNDQINLWICTVLAQNNLEQSRLHLSQLY